MAPQQPASHALISSRHLYQKRVLLKVYTYYRVALSIILLIGFELVPSPFIGKLKPILFSYAASLYLLVNFLSLPLVFFRQRLFDEALLFTYIFIDICFIIIIADSTGGVTGGLGILLVVTTAASSMLLSSRLATLTAAIASIFILTDTIHLISQGYLDHSSLLPSGLLGVVMFATTLAIQYLSVRIKLSQQYAEQSAANVVKLEHINQLIVQRMRTGIIVCNQAGDINILNKASVELLSTTSDTLQQHTQLPDVLKEQLRQWQQAPLALTQAFRTSSTGPAIQASFSSLGTNNETLIFLEDIGTIAQRAQQIKLASLGRLTASIAHEIRNPLGAISHAAQLLAESDALDKADLRLSNIIQNHCLRMNDVIENVLQLSRRSNTAPQKIDLLAWLAKFIEDYTESISKSAQIQLHSELPSCIVSIDPGQFRQVISNLVENGLRYSRQKTGQATITLELNIDLNRHSPILDIIDDGEGIPTSSQEQIFEPFFTTETQGTGLGLFIAREMCEANQARLAYLFNAANKSCFRISFPHPERRLTQESLISFTE